MDIPHLEGLDKINRLKCVESNQNCILNQELELKYIFTLLFRVIIILEAPNMI